MKQFILLIITLTGFSSCKKKYNCHCSSTVIFANYGVQSLYTSKNVPMNRKMTEKQAKSVCANEESNIDATYANFVTNNGNWSSNGITASTICTLE